MEQEKRRLDRRNFALYMGVVDELSGKLLGTLVDISTGGFKLESKREVPLNIDVRLRIEHTNEISSKSFITFVARTRWCQRDVIDPSTYNIGFQIVDMTPADYDIFVQMFNTYGSNAKSRLSSNSDYFWY
jgi:hypothetical protein